MLSRSAVGREGKKERKRKRRAAHPKRGLSHRRRRGITVITNTLALLWFSDLIYPDCILLHTTIIPRSIKNVFLTSIIRSWLLS